jgi:glutamate dehydrogenase
MTAHMRLARPLVEQLRKALTLNALPGETRGLHRDAERDAADFLAQIAAKRKKGELALSIESTGGEAGRRRMRIGIVNDDMPFLVDSVANAIAARQLTIHRLLHPVICVTRNEDGVLNEVEPLCSDKSRRESMMYLELDRADARGRQELAADLRRVLDDVRLAVRDWHALQDRMRLDAANIEDAEGRALLEWFAEGAMTLLGYHVEKPYEAPSDALGIFSIPGAPTDKGGALGAMRYFEQGGEVPLMAKAERKSSVHRRVPLTLSWFQFARRAKSSESESTPAFGPARRCGCRLKRSRFFAGACSSSMRISGSIRRAIRARRCATPSVRSRATCSSPSPMSPCARW